MSYSAFIFITSTTLYKLNCITQYTNISSFILLFYKHKNAQTSISYYVNNEPYRIWIIPINNWDSQYSSKMFKHMEDLKSSLLQRSVRSYTTYITLYGPINFVEYTIQKNQS